MSNKYNFRDVFTPNQRHSSKHPLQYRTSVHNKKAGKRKFVFVKIRTELMERMDWVIGMRVKLMQDRGDEKVLALVRSEKGYKLQPADASQVYYSEQQGTQNFAQFKVDITDRSVLPETNGTTVDVLDFEILKYDDAPRTLVFTLPRSN